MATAVPQSLWKCTPIGGYFFSFRLDRVFASCVGRIPPFVSHMTSRTAPASLAISMVLSVYSRSTRRPSKKCSRSKITLQPWSVRNLTESNIISKFFSGSTPKTFSAWALEAFPTSVTYSVSAFRSDCRCGSFSTLSFGFLVKPKATILAWARGTFFIRSK